MSGFSSRQLKKLAQPLNSNQIYTRYRDGKTLSYIPGWLAISQANAVFGHAGWDRQTIQLERLYERSSQDGISCCYLARVRVVVRAGETAVTREATGFGTGTCRIAADAHEIALKTAETDATKRALATFGNRFGLFLYQGTKSQPTALPPVRVAGFALIAPDGATIAESLSGEAFATGMRQMIEKLDTPKVLDDLIHRNDASLTRLEYDCPHLVSRSNRHYAAILRNLASTKRNAKAGTASELTPAAETECPSIGNPESRTSLFLNQELMDSENIQSDQLGGQKSPAQKATPHEEPTAPVGLASLSSSLIGNGSQSKTSKLAYRSERRVRNKQHLLYVAGRPCVICGESPCHAHHITFAQSRGLALKVSDEFTVPLCVVHHNHVHQYRPEIAWWRNQGLDPLTIAAQLWCDTLRRATEITQ